MDDWTLVDEYCPSSGNKRHPYASVAAKQKCDIRLRLQIDARNRGKISCIFKERSEVKCPFVSATGCL